MERKKEKTRGPKSKDPRPLVALGTPKPPSFLDTEAKKHWKLTVALIAEAGYSSRLDADVLTHYVILWSKWRAAEASVKKDGAVIKAPNGYLQPNPWHVIAMAALKDMKPYLDMLGLTPKSRSKLKLPEPVETGGKWDEFDEQE